MTKTKWFIIEGNEFRSRRKARTLREAFEKSIAKWRLIVDGKVPNYALTTCGLCDRYAHRHSSRCERCPIKMKTGYSGCNFSPFDDWDVNPNKRNAKAELNFLIALKKETLK